MISSVKLLTSSLKCLRDFRYCSYYNVSIYRRQSSVYSKSNCLNFRVDVGSSFLFKISSSLNLNYRNYSSDSYFCLDDYDCVGFDLDNTICEYNLHRTVRHEYNILAEYLVKEFGYNGESLLKPLQPADIDFLQKGLIVDAVRGNLLRIRYDGYIFRANHGSKFLSDEEIVQCYGSDRKWSVTTNFAQDPVVAWYGSSADKLRTLADYFDMPAALVLSRCIRDKITVGDPFDCGGVWNDVRQGLLYIYDRSMFALDQGYFSTDVKTNPGQYYYKCRPAVINWLKELKKRKVTFLITGSNVDHASHTAGFCLGENWRDYFDIVVCYSRKPGFFVSNRDFVKLDGFKEVGSIKDDEIKRGGIYSQGNWSGLLKLLSRITNNNNPKCLYIGDNLIQDIFTVSRYTCCDTVAIAEELAAEYFKHPHNDFLVSKSWGSYFTDKSLWASIIQNHSKICIPSLDSLANKSFDYKFRTFTSKSSGYHSLESPIDLNDLTGNVTQGIVS